MASLITFVPVAAMFSLASTTVLGQHSGDVLLTVESGSIHTAAISEDGLTITPNVRVFVSRFGDLVRGFTDEPGFDSEPGTFPAPSQVGFRIRRALRHWSGGTFDAISTASIAVSFGPLGPVSTPSSDTVTTGFSLAVGGSGQWHRHLEYALTPPHAGGIFLMELSLFSSAAEIGESRPFWLVFGNEATDAELDLAVQWVLRRYVCPADFNTDGRIGVQDIFDYLTAYFAGSTAADINGVGGVTVQDVFDYLVSYFAACPA